MKDKIMYLIIGMLLGAIITTTGFLIYNKLNTQNSNPTQMMPMNGNNQMQAPQNGNMGEPPEKPDGDSNEQPPTKPDSSNNNING